MKRAVFFGVVATVLGLPAVSSAEKFATKTSRCDSVTVTAVYGRDADAPVVHEVLQNTIPSPVLEIYLDRSRGEVRAAKIIRTAAGGKVDVLSIPLPVIVEYANCSKAAAAGRGIVVEYHDAKDFLP